jgi:hypothetical protein
MKSPRCLSAAALAIASVSGFASAQTVAPAGRMYVYQSPPQFRCPGLNWLLVAGENGALSGMVSWGKIAVSQLPQFARFIRRTTVRLPAHALSPRDLFQFGLTTHHDLGEQDVAFVLTLADGSDTSGIYNSMAQRLTAFVESAVVGQEIEIDNRG